MRQCGLNLGPDLSFLHIIWVRLCILYKTTYLNKVPLWKHIYPAILDAASITSLPLMISNEGFNETNMKRTTGFGSWSFSDCSHHTHCLDLTNRAKSPKIKSTLFMIQLSKGSQGVSGKGKCISRWTEAVYVMKCTFRTSLGLHKVSFLL